MNWFIASLQKIWFLTYCYRAVHNARTIIYFRFAYKLLPTLVYHDSYNIDSPVLFNPSTYLFERMSFVSYPQWGCQKQPQFETCCITNYFFMKCNFQLNRCISFTQYIQNRKIKYKLTSFTPFSPDNLMQNKLCNVQKL